MSFLLSLLTVCLLSSADVSASVSADNQSSYQTAFLYFLPDYEPKQVDEAEARGCNKLGYTYTRSNCASPHILKDKCPVGNIYKTCFCAGSPTCTGSLSSANPYSNTTGTSLSSCTDCPGNKRYTWSCSRQCAVSVSSKPSNSSYTTCSDCSGTYNIGWACNSGYYKSGNSCICSTSCSDSVSSKPANSSYTTSSCTACGVTTTIYTGWECNSGYHKSGNTCEKDCTPLASETGCQYGTYSCDNGCGGKRTCCKVCDPEDRDCQCPGYVYCGTTKTGSGASCSAGDKTFYETCLVNETCLERYIGCQQIYSASKVPSDYTYVGPYCINNKGEQLNEYIHCSCSGGKCGGKKQCAGNKGHQKDGSTKPCLCTGIYFFDVCDDPCNNDGLGANGGSCGASTGSAILRHYYIKDKCTTLTGSVIKYWGLCNGTDCLGNKGPCYGKKECTNGSVAVDPCTCGGITYGSSCVVKCPYEQTAADCKASQTFVQRCKDNNGTWFGECK